MAFGLENLFIFEKFSEFITHRDCPPKVVKFHYKIPANQWQTINHKLFKTKCYYQSHLTIENNLKVELSVVIS